MKKFWVAGVACGGLLVGASFAYAFVPIPGVDIPYDPANYYSTVGVSIPDSAPSIFTLRELGVSVDTDAFIRDFWVEWITEDYKKNPERYNEFIIYDNYGGESASDSSVIRVGENKVPIHYRAVVDSMLGEDGDELGFIGRSLKWPLTYRGSYGLMNFIASMYDKEPEKYEKYLVQTGSGNVYDPERHQQSIISCLRNQEILGNLQEFLHMKKEDAKPFGNNGIAAGLKDAHRTITELHHAKDIADGAEIVFVDASMSDRMFAERPEEKQLIYLNDVYKNVAIASQRSIQNGVERRELLEEAMQQSQSAQGAMQAEQAKSDIDVLIQAEILERNMLLENLAAMDAATQKYKTDKKVREERALVDIGQQLQFSDPYHLNVYEKKMYEKPKPLGLPDF